MPELFKELPQLFESIQNRQQRERQLGMVDTRARESMAMRERELGSKESTSRISQKIQMFSTGLEQIINAGKISTDPGEKQKLAEAFKSHIQNGIGDPDIGQMVRQYIPADMPIVQKPPELTEAITETGETVLTPKREGLVTKRTPEKKLTDFQAGYKEWKAQPGNESGTMADFKRVWEKPVKEDMTNAGLTKRALSGDPESKAILNKIQADRIEVAKATGQAALESKISVVDLEGVARSIIEGRETIENVKNTFGIPVQEAVRKEVLKLDPEFNFMQPRIRAAGIKSSLTQQYKNRGMMGSFVKNIAKQVTRMKEIGNDIVSRFGIRALDLPKRELIRRAVGSANENIIQAYMKEIGAEIAKLSQGSAASVQQLPEENRKDWERIHDPNLSMKQLLKILEETNNMANMRLESVDDEITSTLDLLGNVREEPGKSTTAPSGRFKIIKVE